MRCFLRNFVLALVVQLVFLALTFSTGVGVGLMYVLYMLPFAVVDLLIPLPRQVGTGMWSFFALLSIPAVLYSAIIGLILFGFSRIFARR